MSTVDHVLVVEFFVFVAGVVFSIILSDKKHKLAYAILCLVLGTIMVLVTIALANRFSWPSDLLSIADGNALQAPVEIHTPVPTETVPAIPTATAFTTASPTPSAPPDKIGSQVVTSKRPSPTVTVLAQTPMPQADNPVAVSVDFVQAAFVVGYTPANNASMAILPDKRAFGQSLQVSGQAVLRSESGGLVAQVDIDNASTIVFSHIANGDYTLTLSINGYDASPYSFSIDTTKYINKHGKGKGLMTIDIDVAFLQPQRNYQEFAVKFVDENGESIGDTYYGISSKWGGVFTSNTDGDGCTEQIHALPDTYQVWCTESKFAKNLTITKTTQEVVEMAF